MVERARRRLHNLTSKDLEEIAIAVGRTREPGGKHIHWVRDGSPYSVTIPAHGAKALKTKTSKCILDALEVDLEELEELDRVAAGDEDEEDEAALDGGAPERKD